MEKKLKILHTESSMNWGGQEERILKEMRWLLEHGHRSILAADSRSPIFAEAKKRGLDVRAISMRSAYNLFSFLKLSLLVLKFRPNLLNTHSGKDSWLALPLRILGIVIVRSRNIDFIDPIKKRRSYIYRLGCRRVIASCKSIQKSLLEAGVDPWRVDFVGEGVDLKKFHPEQPIDKVLKDFNLHANAPLFGVVAMFRSEKGHSYFLEAAAKVHKEFPEARFLIVGEEIGSRPGARKKMEKQIAKLFPNQDPPVIFTGYRDDIPNIMCAMTALIVPSTKEAQTMVIPQAFASGRTAVAFPGGGIPDILFHEKNGLMAEFRSSESLAENMLRLLKDPELHDRLRSEALRFATEKLSFDVKMEELLACYRRAL
ncbi:MAG: glycosyltransferase family 4 protein [Chthoniobacterales bacterium]